MLHPVMIILFIQTMTLALVVNSSWEDEDALYVYNSAFSFLLYNRNRFFTFIYFTEIIIIASIY
jgi:hypothetical protein